MQHQQPRQRKARDEQPEFRRAGKQNRQKLRRSYNQDSQDSQRNFVEQESIEQTSSRGQGRGATLGGRTRQRRQNEVSNINADENGKESKQYHLSSPRRAKRDHRGGGPVARSARAKTGRSRMNAVVQNQEQQAVEYNDDSDCVEQMTLRQSPRSKQNPRYGRGRQNNLIPKRPTQHQREVGAVLQQSPLTEKRMIRQQRRRRLK